MFRELGGICLTLSILADMSVVPFRVFLFFGVGDFRPLAYSISTNQKHKTHLRT